MERDCCEFICGAPTTFQVYGIELNRICPFTEFILSPFENRVPLKPVLGGGGGGGGGGGRGDRGQCCTITLLHINRHNKTESTIFVFFFCFFFVFFFLFFFFFCFQRIFKTYYTYEKLGVETGFLRI